MIDNKKVIEALIKANEEDLNVYDTEYMQAHLEGKIEAYKKVLEIIED